MTAIIVAGIATAAAIVGLWRLAYRFAWGL